MPKFLEFRHFPYSELEQVGSEKFHVFAWSRSFLGQNGEFWAEFSASCCRVSASRRQRIRSFAESKANLMIGIVASFAGVLKNTSHPYDFLKKKRFRAIFLNENKIF